MSSNPVQSKAFQQYWMNQFDEGESLDDLTDRLQKLFDKTAEKQFHGHDSNTHSWFERTINQAIAAKKAYYSDTATGQISFVFQGIAKAFLGCGGYMTPLERAEAFAQMVSQSNPIEHLNPEVDKELNPAVPGGFKLTQTSLFDARLFFELHKERMLDLARSENMGLCLSIPGEEPISYYVFPNGNCYLVSKTDANKVARGATKEVYRAYDLVNKETVAFMRSHEFNTSSDQQVTSLSLVKNEYAALRRFDGVNGILQVRDGFIQNGSAIFFSDYYDEKSLFHLMRNQEKILTPQQEKHLMIQILKGTKGIHDLGYLHRDLKELNILIQKVGGNYGDEEVLYEPVIIDFDRCCKVDDMPSRQGIASTPDFWPPEYAKVVVDNIPALEQGATKIPQLAEVTTAQMDVWALGLVLYRMHYRKELPWNSSMPSRLIMQKISELKEVWFQPDQHDEIGKVIHRMLQVDPAKRISLADAISQLQPKTDEAYIWSEFFQ